MSITQAAPTDPIPVTKTVTVAVDVAGPTLTVDPPVSFVRKGGSLEFEATGLSEGYTVEIDYKVHGHAKGPFLRPGNAEPRGRVILSSGATKATLRYDDALGTAAWKYDVVLRDGKKVDLRVVDPMTVGKGDT